MKKEIFDFLDIAGFIGLLLSPIFSVMWLISLLYFNNSNNYWILFIFIPLCILSYRCLFVIMNVEKDTINIYGDKN